VARVCSEDEDVHLVSAADKLSNVRETLHDLRVQGESVFKRFKGKKKGTLWYYRALVDEFRKGGYNPLIEELGRAVTELERCAAGADGNTRGKD
jgi:hypothetical protein